MAAKVREAIALFDEGSFFKAVVLLEGLAFKLETDYDTDWAEPEYPSGV